MIHIRVKKGAGEFIEVHLVGISSITFPGGQYMKIDRNQLTRLREHLAEVEDFLDGNPTCRVWEV